MNHFVPGILKCPDACLFFVYFLFSVVTFNIFANLFKQSYASSVKINKYLNKFIR